MGISFSPGVIDYRSNSAVVAVYALAGPIQIAYNGVDSMWVTSVSSTTLNVSKVTLTGTITTYTHNFGVGNAPYPVGIAYDGSGNMWVPIVINATHTYDICKIDSSGTFTIYSLSTKVPSAGIALDSSGNMWVPFYDSGADAGVYKISSTGTVTTYSISGGGSVQPEDIVFDGTYMWTSNGDGSFWRIDSSGTFTVYTSLGNIFENIEFDGTNLWGLNYNGSSYDMKKVSTAGSLLGTFPLSSVYTTSGALGLHFNGTYLWIAAHYPGHTHLTRIDANGNTVLYTNASISGVNDVMGIASEGNDIWIAGYGDNAIDKVTV